MDLPILRRPEYNLTIFRISINLYLCCSKLVGAETQEIMHETP